MSELQITLCTGRPSRPRRRAPRWSSRSRRKVCRRPTRRVAWARGKGRLERARAGPSELASLRRSSSSDAAPRARCGSHDRGLGAIRRSPHRRAAAVRPGTRCRRAGRTGSSGPTEVAAGAVDDAARGTSKGNCWPALWIHRAATAGQVPRCGQEAEEKVVQLKKQLTWL